MKNLPSFNEFLYESTLLQENIVNESYEKLSNLYNTESAFKSNFSKILSQVAKDNSKIDNVKKKALKDITKLLDDKYDELNIGEYNLLDDKHKGFLAVKLLQSVGKKSL